LGCQRTIYPTLKTGRLIWMKWKSLIWLQFEFLLSLVGIRNMCSPLLWDWSPFLFCSSIWNELCGAVYIPNEVRVNFTSFEAPKPCRNRTGWRYIKQSESACCSQWHPENETRGREA
jgi:hypothetical protein